MHFVYIISNNKGNVIYTGVTSDLKKRIYFHKKGLIRGFTNKYKIHKLIYWENIPDKQEALHREKQIKSYSRSKKNKLIESRNKNWVELSTDLDLIEFLQEE